MSKRAHGWHDTHLVGSVLLTYFKGDFNAEGATARSVSLERAAPVGTRWAALNSSLEWSGADAASLDILRQQREWMFERGCERIATVLADTFHAYMLKHYAGEFDKDVVRYFLTHEEACAWLSEGGFPIRPEDLPPPAWQAA